MANGSNNSHSAMAGVCFFVYCLLEGLQRVSGVLFLAIMEFMGSCRMSAAIPFVMSRAIANVTGVLLQFLKEHQEPRAWWLLWGASLSAVGTGLCFLTTEVLWVSVFWGIIFGAGIGITSPLLIEEFTKQRNQSIISFLGPASPSFGCIFLPFLINWLLINYGLDGCFLILAGLILNCIPCILISKYKIQFHFIKPKWRLRKRSKRYHLSENKVEENYVSSYKPSGIKEFLNESFIQSLEPDTLQKVSDSDTCDINKYGFVDIFQPIIDAKKKMVTNEVFKQEDFESKRNQQNIKHSEEEEYLNKKLSELVDVMQKPIFNEMRFQTSKVIEQEAVQIERNQQNLSCCAHEKHFNEKLSEVVADIQKYEKSRLVFEGSFTHNDVVSADCADPIKNRHGCERQSHPDFSLTERQHLEVVKDTENNETVTNCQQKHAPPIISSSNTTFHVKKGTSHQSNEVLKNFPLEIKVHVVECTITTNAEFHEETVDNKIPPTSRKNGYRRHSNSLISGCYDNIDFTQLLLNDKASPLHKHQLNLASRMFLITEEDEYDAGGKSSSGTGLGIEVPNTEKITTKTNSVVQKFRKLLKPCCLAIIYACVTYEFTLAVLLTIFADFAKDTKDTIMSSNFVMVAFGLGGIVGQAIFTYWRNRVLVDGSYAAAAIIFMLNGLAVAGILWAEDICWLSGFYAILGFVESGIMLTVPRLIADYVEEGDRMLLSNFCKCLGAVAIACIPFAIGLDRDKFGDYDGLLQVTSCLSVLCTVVCYFLPKLSRV